MEKKFLIIILLLLIISCKNTSQKYPRKSQKVETRKGQVQSTLKLSPMEEQLIRDYYEIEEPEGIIVQPNDMQVKCTDLAVRLICQELIRRGFKPLPSQEAYKRVYQIFGVDLNKRPEELIQEGFWIYTGKRNTRERNMQKNIMALKTVPDGQTFGAFWDLQTFVPQYNCIILSPSLDQVVTIKGTVKGADGEEYMDTEKGKIVYSLDKSIFYRNQFIFHDSKDALTWLMNNDKDFLRDLFLKYGYDKSDVINKMMIDEVKGEEELPIGKEYKKLFVSKGMDGRLLIHQALLQYMLKHANRQNLYYCMLDEYLSYLLDLENEPEFDNLTKEERYKAGAYIGYYYGLMYEKCIGTPCDNQSFGYALYYQKDFISYIKKNNYFHLKDFDKIIQIQYDRYQEGVEIERHRMSGE
ncbi:hypothetical protein CRM71_01550 [Prevotella jejuni]|uniref:Uncharacterized protein n=2 Tax=Prevotella jejuni TaxID=1177574 RepID=A0A2K9HHT7_9BACT|nr:hypothetical protein [Prevotella jejuni]AUI54142.1 hypothetical protein CRM71_01550 [Prevotella jejuni]SNR93337.1 hypothetical protein SAMN06265364_12059 [Prevotella jejuni]